VQYLFVRNQAPFVIFFVLPNYSILIYWKLQRVLEMKLIKNVERLLRSTIAQQNLTSKFIAKI